MQLRSKTEETVFRRLNQVITNLHCHGYQNALEESQLCRTTAQRQGNLLSSQPQYDDQTAPVYLQATNHSPVYQQLNTIKLEHQMRFLHKDHTLQYFKL